MKSSVTPTPALQKRLVHALAACPPGVVMRILPTMKGAPSIFGLNYVPQELTPTHLGYLTGQIIDLQNAAARGGEELRILLANERRGSVEPYRQLDLSPALGRVLLCAVGPLAASALQAIAVAEQNWPEAATRFDLDGAPINENGVST